MSANVGQYMPSTMRDFAEIKAIIEAENKLFDLYIEPDTVRLLQNQFIMTADSDGIKSYEDIVGLVADTATESLEFRRQRLLLRFSMLPPFTMVWLRNKLDGIIGTGKYTATIDYEQYQLIIESSAQDQQWFEEINILINGTKPANIVFINKPLITTANVKVAETISLAETIYNYKLGTTWVLGTKPFANTQDIGVIKLPTVPSIGAYLLSSSAQHVIDDVTVARLNNTYDVTVFENKYIDGNNAIFEYTVPNNAGLGTITNVKLLDNKGNVFTNSPVIVMSGTDVVIKHKIPFVEGV